MQSISMIDANDFVEAVIIDKVSYKLHFMWNDDGAQWTMDLRDYQNNDIVRGIAIVPNFPLLSLQKRQKNVPLGELMAVVVNQNEADNQAIGRKDFVNGKFSFVYIPESELNAIIQANV